MKTAVLALGGNAISPKGEQDTIHNQFANTRKSIKTIMQFVQKGYHLAISHGNGPQVGNALLRVELTMGKAPYLPLGICVADTEGGMGYMIEQSLQNALMDAGLERDVVSVITQVIVDKDDPSIDNPTKFIGGWYTAEEIQELARKNNWQVKEVNGKGWRRVVPSPIPRKIINRKIIRKLVREGNIVIAAGGGGIPVYIMENGHYEGFDAVIDKDLASAAMARDIHADELFILTDVDQVALNYGQADQQNIGEIHYQELQRLHQEGHFPPGSMGPKVLAAIHFIESGGQRAVITSLEKAPRSVDGKSGTIVLP